MQRERYRKAKFQISKTRPDQTYVKGEGVRAGQSRWSSPSFALPILEFDSAPHLRSLDAAAADVSPALCDGEQADQYIASIAFDIEGELCWTGSIIEDESQK